MSDSLIKTAEELEIIRDGGKILAKIFKELEDFVEIGIDSITIDKYAEKLCSRYKVKPAFKGYNGFPYSICANPNDVIVHGFPNNNKLKSGDIFGLDMGIIYKGFYLDMSSTIVLGNVSEDVSNFVKKTEISMKQGINAARQGNHIGDISEAMRNGLVGDKFRLMRHFIGHGIGRRLHEAPEIPGEGMEKGEGIEIKPGMVFAIESISVMGGENDYVILSDGWTVKSKNGYLSSLFEHTMIVTDNGPEIVTNYK